MVLLIRPKLLCNVVRHIITKSIHHQAESNAMCLYRYYTAHGTFPSTQDAGELVCNNALVLDCPRTITIFFRYDEFAGLWIAYQRSVMSMVFATKQEEQMKFNEAWKSRKQMPGTLGSKAAKNMLISYQHYIFDNNL